MAPRAFSKLFSSRSSNRSNGSDRRSSLESIDSGDSYVISLPSYSQAIALAEQPARTLAVEPHPQPAEMLDDDNLAWGRPSRKQRSKTQWGRS
ncbi:hypothetical protein K466DRAFT_594712 [Polyporus arcularius HHB13444]|uniref:Uncharacterized protein n=1 Tax=Polyporus arcularius HHB13444 TaxID=1314778 RepID=A0A5C3PU98_9APHY|nr:hypothetical protein K466DRAFT_594712 [Polyporus arcularius HHB13444]